METFVKNFANALLMIGILLLVIVLMPLALVLHLLWLPFEYISYRHSSFYKTTKHPFRKIDLHSQLYDTCNALARRNVHFELITNTEGHIEAVRLNGHLVIFWGELDEDLIYDPYRGWGNHDVREDEAGNDCPCWVSLEERLTALPFLAKCPLECIRLVFGEDYFTDRDRLIAEKEPRFILYKSASSNIDPLVDVLLASCPKLS